MASLKQSQIYGALKIYNGTNENNITIDPNENGGKLTFSDDVYFGKAINFKSDSTNSNNIINVHSIEFNENGSEITKLNKLDMTSGGTITFSSPISGTVIEGTKIKFMKPFGDTTSTTLDASELDIGTGLLAGSTEPFRIRGSSNSIPEGSVDIVRKDRELRIIAPTYISSGYDISYNPDTTEKELFEKNILSIINNTLLIKSYNKKAHSTLGYEYNEEDVASFDNEKIIIYKPLYGCSDNDVNGYGGITIARNDSSESEVKDKNITLTLSPTKISFNGRNPIRIGGDDKTYSDSLNNNYKSIAIGHQSQTNADKAIAIGFKSNATLNSIAIGNEASCTGSNAAAIGSGASCTETKRLQLPTDWRVFAGTTEISDRLDKTNIRELSNSYTSFLMDLKPVTYNFNYRSNYTVKNPDPKFRDKYGIEEYDKTEHLKASKANKRTHVGFIAQDVKKTIEKHFPNNDHLDIVSIDKMDTGEFQRGEVDPGYERYYMNYSAMIPVLVKVLQEQQEEINYLKSEIEKLKK